ncbi:MAG: hypothetical protein JST20_03660 [Bacteroidetes bacterium]|nr:hypothetical protein [Bacteroidota bacterium]
MKIYLLTVSILILLVPLTSFSQEKTFDSLYNAVGLKMSNISGYGFYYNRKVSDRVRLQAMGLIYYYYNQSKSDNEIHKNFNYDFGFEIQQDIYQSPSFRMFLLAGSYYYYDDDSKEKSTQSLLSINNSFNVGVGLSGEYLYKRFVISFDIGYKFFEDNIVITEDSKRTYPVLKRTTKLGAGLGVGFMF